MPMTMLPISLVVVTCLVTSYVITRISKTLLTQRRIVDTPNARSSHTGTIPRGGGTGIAGGMLCGVFLSAILFDQPPRPDIILGFLGFALVGFADDVSGGIRVSLRLGLQLLIALAFCLYRGGFDVMPWWNSTTIELGYWGIPLAVLWIVGVVNVFNFLDGIDGYAATQAVLFSATFLVMATDAGLITLSAALLGSVVGFLLLNWHPAKIFLGDIGSYGVGFLLATMPFHAEGPRRVVLSFYALLLLWFFISDSAFTILRRARNGEKIWKPHRSHLYQRLVISGMKHDRVVILFILVSLPMCALVVLANDSIYLTFHLIAGAYAIIGFATYVLFVRFREKKSPVDVDVHH